MPVLPDSLTLISEQANSAMGYKYQLAQQQLQEAQNQATYNPEVITSGNPTLDAEGSRGVTICQELSERTIATEEWLRGRMFYS